MTNENLPEYSEDENCCVTIIPTDDGGSVMEIEMTDELAERLDRGGAALGLTREDYIRHLIDSNGEDDTE